MKKIAMLLLSAMLTTAAWAVKAYPLPVVITQSDGTQLTVTAHGDADLHWFTTTDGTLLCRQGRSFYVASVGDDGTLTPTSQLAHEPSLRQDAERRLASLQDKQRFLTSAATLRRKAARHEPVGQSTRDVRLFPHTGSPRVAVILAQFSDTTRVDIVEKNKEGKDVIVDQTIYQARFADSDPKAVFEEYLNGTSHPLNSLGETTKYTLARNIGSVSTYFSDMSFGQFTPQFDVFGPVTVPGKLRDYGAGERDNMTKFIPAVCKAANEQCADLDFSQYDSNNDGYVDLVYIIYAGYSASYPQNDEVCIWPKSSAISSSTTYDGKKIYRYGVNNELNAYPGANPDIPYYINGIGLFCHEFSHTMGLPDFYPASNDNARINNQALEFWSLMDGGEYVTNGYAPTAYTAYEREAMGWLDIETLSQTTLGLQMATIDRLGKDERAKAYRINNPYDETGHDYYLLQNVQQKNWNQDQKGHGLLVFHINYDRDIFSLSSNKVNDDPGYPRMTIVPADGLLFTSYNIDNKTYDNAYYYNQLSGDPFPGTSNVTTLSDQSRLPNFAPWHSPNLASDGTRLLGMRLENISEDDGIVTFDFFASEDDYQQHLTGIKEPTASLNTANPAIYDLSGRRLKTTSLPKGIYIVDGKKAVVK